MSESVIAEKIDQTIGDKYGIDIAYRAFRTEDAFFVDVKVLLAPGDQTDEIVSALEEQCVLLATDAGKSDACAYSRPWWTPILVEDERSFLFMMNADSCVMMDTFACFQEWVFILRHLVFAMRQSLNWFSKERLEAACQYAKTSGALSRKSIVSILEKGLDKQPHVNQQDITIGIHKNVRGSRYYH